MKPAGRPATRKQHADWLPGRQENACQSAARPPRHSMQICRLAAQRKPQGPAGNACRPGLKPGGLAQPSFKSRRYRRPSRLGTLDDMLTDLKSTLRVGDTLVRLIFMSDGTHHSNFAGMQKEWSVYMTNGNISSKICQMDSTHSVVMVALPRIPINNGNIHQKRHHEQRHKNREVLNEVLLRILQPLTLKHNPSAESRNYDVLCAHGNLGHRNPV